MFLRVKFWPWQGYFQLSVYDTVIRDCSGFALRCFVIGPENLRHSLNQSDAKLRSISSWSPAFSRALGSLLVVTLILIGS